MSLRRFATREELNAALDTTLADAIWSAAQPTTDEFGNESPSADPVFGGVLTPADGDLPAELNVTKAIARLDQLKAELRKVR